MGEGGREEGDGVRWGREKVRKRTEEENSKKYVRIYTYIHMCTKRENCREAEAAVKRVQVRMYVPMYGQPRL